MDPTPYEDGDNYQPPTSNFRSEHLRSSHLLPGTLPVSNSTPSMVSLTSTLLPKSTLPIVIPQTSRALRGVYFSPFLRAYPETLDTIGISKADFIRFIDNLNEAFMSSPFFYGVMLAGTIASFVPELAAQVVGGVVATASSLASTANSHVRTKHFIKAANNDIFAPRGLQVRLLNTKNMLQAINVDEGTFKLPTLPESNAPELEKTHEDPRHRWMQALKNVVSPLDYNAPDYSEQDSWLKKAGAWTAKHQDKRQAMSLTKRREKAKKTIDAAQEEAVQNEQIIECAIKDHEADLYALSLQPSDDPKAESKRRRDMVGCEEAIHQEQAKLIDERKKKDEVTEKAIGKVDKKEHKVVQKIRWIVITPSTGSEVADEDIDDGVEDVHPLKNWSFRSSEKKR